MSINVKAREAYQMLEAGVVYPDMDSERVVNISESHMGLSIAISLKRIADALTGDGQNILTMPLNHFGENIGTAISGQIFRAMRGDDR